MTKGANLKLTDLGIVTGVVSANGVGWVLE